MRACSALACLIFIQAGHTPARVPTDAKARTTRARTNCLHLRSAPPNRPADSPSLPHEIDAPCPSLAARDTISTATHPVSPSCSRSNSVAQCIAQCNGNLHPRALHYSGAAGSASVAHIPCRLGGRRHGDAMLMRARRGGEPRWKSTVAHETSHHNEHGEDRGKSGNG